MGSFLTGLPCKVVDEGLENYKYYYDPVCGLYAVSEYVLLEDLPATDRRKIAFVLAQRKTRHGEHLTMVTVNQSGSFGKWRMVPAQDIIREFPADASLIVEECLLNLSYRVELPSDKILLDEAVSWSLYSHNKQALNYMFRQMEGLGYIARTGEKTQLDNGNIAEYVTLESQGWRKLAELKERNVESKDAFVAMWFDSSMDDVFELGIRPALENSSFNPVRIDGVEHNNKICDEIIAKIKRSRFLIADFTGNRGGVYFEAGFAQGLSIPVIWLVEEAWFKENGVHFDTRQYNHIVYSDASDLKERLQGRIAATII